MNDEDWLQAIEYCNETGTVLQAYDYAWRVCETRNVPKFRNLESFKSSLKHHAKRLGAALVLRVGRPPIKIED